MAKSAKIYLGEAEYDVPMLNIGQLERVTDLIVAGGTRVGFSVLRIALERATPKVEDAGAVEASADQVRGAVKSIMVMSGFEPEAPSAGEAQPAAA